MDRLTHMDRRVSVHTPMMYMDRQECTGVCIGAHPSCDLVTYPLTCSGLGEVSVR